MNTVKVILTDGERQFRNAEGQMKFLIYCGTLIIGGTDSHLRLLGLYKRHAGFEAVDLALVTAAGTCLSDGEVVGWNSQGLSCSTPDEMREELQRMVRDACASKD